MKNGVAVAAEFTGLPEPQSREKSGEKNESQIFAFHNSHREMQEKKSAAESFCLHMVKERFDSALFVFSGNITEEHKTCGYKEWKRCILNDKNGGAV